MSEENPFTVRHLETFRSSFPIGFDDLREFAVNHPSHRDGPRIKSIEQGRDGSIAVTYSDGRGWLITAFGYGAFG